MRIILLQLITCVFSIAADPSRENGGVKTAAAEERGPVVPERLDVEVSINGYPESRANGRHNPSHP
jgi:hypothetical protein